MTACARFESEGFQQWEQGQAPDAHVRSCPECLARWRSLDRLGPALSHEPPVTLPSPQWKARVLAAAGAEHAPAGRRWFRPALWFTPVFAVASVALVLAVVKNKNDALRAPALDFALVAADSRRTRGQGGPEVAAPTAAVGDRLKLFGAAPGGSHFELRVYRNGKELVFRCPPGCTVADGRFEVDVPLSVPGRYEALAIVSRDEVPAPGDTRAADVARIERAGGRLSEVPAIEVK